MTSMVDRAAWAAPELAGNGTVTIGLSVLLLLVLGAATVGVISRKTTTVGNALLIGMFFVVLTAVTPLGDLVVSGIETLAGRFGW
jgi:hypothetical protein